MISIKQSTIKGAGKGVFANRDLKKNTLLAEYKGEYLTLEDYEERDSGEYVWQILDDEDEIIGYVDGINIKHSNWTRYVNCPSTKKQENVKAIQKMYKMYYYTSKDIKKGEELFVWYGPEYGKKLTGRDHLL